MQPGRDPHGVFDALQLAGQCGVPPPPPFTAPQPVAWAPPAHAISVRPGESLQAHFLIKAVQIREELQRKGDALDSALRRKEKECRMLQHTLDGLTEQNAKCVFCSLFASGAPAHVV